MLPGEEAAYTGPYYGTGGGIQMRPEPGRIPNATTGALSCCLCCLHEHASRRLWHSVPCLAQEPLPCSGGGFFFNKLSFLDMCKLYYTPVARYLLACMNLRGGFCVSTQARRISRLPPRTVLTSVEHCMQASAGVTRSASITSYTYRTSLGQD